MWVYCWALNSVPLMYVSVFVSILYSFDYYEFVVQFEIRKHEASSFAFSEDCVDYWGLLAPMTL